MAEEDQVLWVHVTTADAEEARRISRALVEERLAACASILPGHTAIHRWEGRLEEAPEGTFLTKTRVVRFEALRARIRALHSYSLPVAALSQSSRRPPRPGMQVFSTGRGPGHRKRSNDRSAPLERRVARRHKSVRQTCKGTE